MRWDPQSSAAGSGTLTFYKVPADASFAVAPSRAGATVLVSAPVPVQNAKVTFTGTAERVLVQASAWAYAGPAYLTVKNPDGSSFSSGNTILVDPQGSATGSMTLTLADPPDQAP